MTVTGHRAAILVVGLTAAGVLGGCGAEPAPGRTTTTAPYSSTGPSSSPATQSGVAPGSVTTSGPAGPATRTITVTVRGGQISGDTGRIAVPLGTAVTLFVSSDVADEVHLHGYDREAQIPAGGVGSISFLANIPGVFEVELHGADLQLLQLQVS